MFGVSLLKQHYLSYFVFATFSFNTNLKSYIRSIISTSRAMVVELAVLTTSIPSLSIPTNGKKSRY